MEVHRHSPTSAADSHLSVAIMHIRDRQELESAVRLEHINPMIIRHYDYDFDIAIRFDKQTTINTLGPYGCGGLRSTRIVHYQKYIDINTRLLEVLRKEYHLK